MFKRDLNEITAFLAVAREGGFTAAAERTGQPKSYLSRKVSELEARLELRLLNRTTRSVSLTPDGERYHEACEKAFAELDGIESDFKESLGDPSGHLRVTCPVEFGEILAQKICREFLIKYPNITLEIFPSNSIVDLVRDQFDVAIRPSHLAQQDMISINLGTFDWQLYASRLWVDSNPKVKSIKDLADRQIIAFNPSGKFKKNWKIDKTPYKPRFIAGNLATLIEATLQGSGVALLPNYLIEEELKNKKVIQILPEKTFIKEDIFALYSSKLHMSSRMRVFLDYLRKSKLFRKL